MQRKSRGLSPQSLRQGLKPLRQIILQRAVRRKLILANPALDLEWRPAPEVDKVDPFTAQGLRAIFVAARQEVDDDFAAMLQFWAQTGMRAGEVVANPGA